MNSIKRLFFVILAFFTLAASPAAGQTTWFYDQADLFFSPESVDGAAARVIESTGEFVGLIKTPALKLARCSVDLNCTWETVENDLAGPDSLGPVYLFEDNAGIFALYEHQDTGEVRLARPDENGWNKAALILPEPCPNLLSAAHQPAGWLGLLCADEDGQVIYQWLEDGVWQVDDQLGLNTETDEVLSQSLAILSDGQPYVVFGRDDDSILLIHREEADGWVGEKINTKDAWQPRIVANEADEVFILAVSNDCLLYFYQSEGVWQEERRGLLWHAAYSEPEIFSAGLTTSGEVSCLFKWFFTHSKSSELPAAIIFEYILSESADYTYFIDYSFEDGSRFPIFSGQIAANDNHQALVTGFYEIGFSPTIALYFSEDYQMVTLGEEYNTFNHLAAAARRVDGGLTPYAGGNNWPTYGFMHTLHRKIAEGWDMLDRVGADYFTNIPPIIAANDTGLYYLHNCPSEPCLSRYSLNGSRYDMPLGDYYLYHGDIAASSSGVVFVATGWDDVSGQSLYFWRRPTGGPISSPIVVDIEAYNVGIALCPDGTARIIYNKNGAAVLATEGTEFTTEVIAENVTGNNALNYPVACDSHGKVHIAFLREDGLIYGVQTDDGWIFENLGEVGQLFDMVLARGDQPYIGYSFGSQAYVVTRSDKAWSTLDLIGYEALDLWSDGEDILICYQTYTDLRCQSSAPIVGYTGGGDDDDNNNDNDNDDDDNNDNDNDDNNDNNDNNNNDNDDNNDNNNDDDSSPAGDDDDNNDNDDSSPSGGDDDDDDDDDACGG